MMGWLILITYVLGFFIAWIVCYTRLYSDFGHDGYTGPVEAILMSGFLSMIVAFFWPIVLVIFGIHRIATKNVRHRDD